MQNDADKCAAFTVISSPCKPICWRENFEFSSPIMNNSAVIGIVIPVSARNMMDLMKNRVSRVSRGNIFSSFKIDRFANVCIITEVSLRTIPRACPVHPKGPSSRRGEAKRLGKTLLGGCGSLRMRAGSTC